MFTPVQYDSSIARSVLILTVGLATFGVLAAAVTASPEASAPKPFARCGTTLIGGRPDWSPDGHELAYDYDSVSPTRRTSVWRIRVDGTHPQLVAEDANTPAWSPDGQWIAARRGGSPDLEVVIFPVSGGEPRVVTTGTSPRWWPTGDKLVVARPLTNKVAIVALDGSTVREFAADGSSDFDISPDGASLVYPYSGFPGVQGLWLAPTDGSRGHYVLDPRPPFRSYGHEPRWSPDGSVIAYTAVALDESYLPHDAGIGLIRPDGTSGGSVTFGDQHSPAWSPDGTHLAYVQGSAIWIVERNGLAAHPVAPHCTFGSSRNDALTPAVGARALYGFNGNDVIRARDRRPEYINCGPGRDRAYVDLLDSVNRNCEVVLRARRR